MKQQPKIVREVEPTVFNPVIQYVGGKEDGMEFTYVEVLLEDGSKGGAWKCPSIPGYLKQVFVPWESPTPTFPSDDE